MSPWRAVLFGLILTCPVGQEEACDSPKSAWIEVHHTHPTSGEILYTEVVCGNRIKIDGRCVTVTRDPYHKVVAAACPGMAVMTDLPADWERKPAEEEP